MPDEDVGEGCACHFAPVLDGAAGGIARRALTSTALAQLERARGGDLLAGGLRPSYDQDRVARRPRRSCTGRSCARSFPSLSVGEHEDVVAARPLSERAHRHGDRLARRARRHLHADRGAGRGDPAGARRSARGHGVPRRAGRPARRSPRSGRGSARRVVLADDARPRRPRAVPRRRAGRTVKSTLAASATPWSVVSWVPSFRYWPGCTSAMPTRARNGARMVFRAMIALVRAIWAWATSRAARAWSTSSWATALLLAQRLHAGRAWSRPARPAPSAPRAPPPRPTRRAPPGARRPRRCGPG